MRNAIDNMPQVTQYALWRMSAICHSAMRPEFLPLIPSDAEFYMMVKRLMNIDLPGEKKLIKKSILKKMLNEFISSYPLEYLLDSNDNTNRELMRFSQLLSNVIHPKILTFYDGLGIDKNASFQDRLVYLENSVHHWRKLAKKAMDNTKDKVKIRQLQSQIANLTEQLNQLQQVRIPNNNWHQQQVLFENVTDFEERQNNRFPANTNHETVNNQCKSDSVLWEKSF